MLASVLVVLALAPAAVAGGPANSEYSLNIQGPGGGKPSSGGGQLGGSGGSSALPVLLVGAGALASAGVVVAYLRYRRRSGAAT